MTQTKSTKSIIPGMQIHLNMLKGDFEEFKSVKLIKNVNVVKLIEFEIMQRWEKID